MSKKVVGQTVPRTTPIPRSFRRVGKGRVSTPSPVDGILELLSSAQVVVPQGSEARDYLLQHNDLAHLLPRICQTVRERFGADTQLSLEVYRDSEIEDEYLSLYVRQQRYAPDIMQSIEEIREGYEEELAGRSGWFLVTTDFRSPK